MTRSNRIRTTLTIAVEDIDFDTQACKLRLKGRNIQENDHVKMGAYHTIDLVSQCIKSYQLNEFRWFKCKNVVSLCLDQRSNFLKDV